jgi:uncharacterized protein
MGKSLRSFQVFVKPAGPVCNLSCDYCYYLGKKSFFPETETFRMPEIILEEYIVQHIEASTESLIRFSWHGGEPTILGLDFFKKLVKLQLLHQPANRRIVNGLQTNGTLLDEQWCDFLSAEGFSVGLSLDGPEKIHDRFRHTRGGKSSFVQAMKGYELLRAYGVDTDILCVVNAHNVKYPLQVYRFFKEIEASYISFLPLVEKVNDAENQVSPRTVPALIFGEFLCNIFDEWVKSDIGRIKIQIFEEAARTAFGQEHSLCIFRKTCGEIPVIEHNGDFFSCDHFVNENHKLGNIIETPLIDLLESRAQRTFGQAKWDKLPGYCLNCEVLEMCNGECPKNRFLKSPEGEIGLNYLCQGYKHFFNHCQPWVDEVAAQWRKYQ